MDVCHVQHLARAISPSRWGKQLMAMFTAYLDESGTHAGSPLLTVAGWVAPVEQWEHFDEEWRRLLRDFHIDFFHMTDFECRQEQFSNWDNPTRLRFIRRAIGIIKSRTKVGVGTGVVLKQYDNVIYGKIRNICGSPYVLAVQGCMLDTVKWLEDWLYRGDIAYVFESGCQNSGEASDAFKKIMASSIDRAKYRVHSISFADKKQVTPLQAADILAYESWKQSSRRYKDAGRQTRKSFDALLKRPGPEYTGRMVSLNGLKLIAKGLRARIQNQDKDYE